MITKNIIIQYFNFIIFDNLQLIAYFLQPFSSLEPNINESLLHIFNLTSALLSFIGFYSII